MKMLKLSIYMGPILCFWRLAITDLGPVSNIRCYCLPGPNLVIGGNIYRISEFFFSFCTLQKAAYDCAVSFLNQSLIICVFRLRG